MDSGRRERDWRTLWAGGLLGFGLAPAGGPGLLPPPTPGVGPGAARVAVQEEGTAPQPPRRQLLDGIAAIVGDECITHRDIDQVRLQEAQQGRTVDPARILEERVKQALKAQGGRTIVLDDTLVQAQVEARWKEIIDERGGATSASEALSGAGFTPASLQEMLKDGLYAQVWEDNVTGAGAGPTGRPKVDRFIRPGQRDAFYRILAKSPNPADRAQVGAMPARVSIQQLVLAVEEYGGVEETRTLANELRGLATSGRTEFSDLVARYGAAGTRESRGMGAPIPLSDMEQLSVTRHRSRSLLDFVTSQPPGSFSEPMLGWKLGSDAQAIFVYRFLEELPEQPPKSPLNLDLQKELDSALLDQFDKVRLEFALREAFDSAYIWTIAQQRGAADGAANDGPNAP